MAYVDHTFHQQSKSTSFLREILAKNFEVTDFWIDPWGDARTVEIETLNSYEYVLFFQKISPLKDLWKLHAKIIWVQMYDSANFDYFYWKNLSFLPIKVLAFSGKIEAQCKKFGVETLRVQYYLEPEKYRGELPAGRHLFFWYRGSLAWQTVRKILNPEEIDSLSYLSKPDPGYQKETVSPEDIKRYKMTIVESEFLPSHDEYLRELSKVNIFIAPRLKEGIGLSFLEALAMGRCVIANDDATMNEYIRHGETGYLFNAENPKPLDLSNIKTVTDNAKRAAYLGYEQWTKSVPSIVEFLKSPSTALNGNPLKKSWFKYLYTTKLSLHPIKETLKARVQNFTRTFR